MRTEHAAGGGRPLITVSEDYANLPDISLIVQNVGQGPAKDDITPRLYEGIRPVDYSGMTDLVDTTNRKIPDNAISDQQKQRVVCASRCDRTPQALRSKLSDGLQSF